MKTATLTQGRPRGMLIAMLGRSSAFRITVALVVALAVGISAPIHAAHRHGDPNSLHSACTLCQLHSPACQPLLEPCAGFSLEPIFTFAFVSAPSLHATSVSITGTRAPPLFLA
jgi:hypothetical protein